MPSTGTRSKLATSPVHSRGPKIKRNYYVTPAFSGVPNAKRGDKIRSGHLTRAFSGAKKRAELPSNPCILGSPQPGAQNQKWPPDRCLVGGAKEGGIAM